MFDVSFLISAEEARERSESACSLECSTELRIASECINKAVENGEYYCWCNNCLHNQAINKLTKTWLYSYKLFNTERGYLFQNRMVGE